METLYNIPKRGIWSDSTEKIDQNFKIFEEELTNIEDDTQKCKGLFPSLQSLQTEYPNPDVGSWAYIGNRLPATIYVYKSPGGWTSTEKSGGGDLDPSIYANSTAINDVEDFFSIESSWIFGIDGSNWENITSNEIEISADATKYIIRPVSLTYGERGETLRIGSSLDSHLYTFKYGYSFVSVNLTSSDGVSETITEGLLSWVINDSYYKKVVGGVEENRLPAAGDTMRVTLKFTVPGESDVKVKIILFKFLAS